VVDPNAFHSRDVSTLRLDDGRVSGGNSEIDSLISAISTGHMVPHAPSTSPRPVARWPRPRKQGSCIHTTRFHAILLTEMQYTRCNILGDVTILKPTSVQSQIEAHLRHHHNSTLVRHYAPINLHWRYPLARCLFPDDRVSHSFSNYLVLTRTPKVGSQQLCHRTAPNCWFQIPVGSRTKGSGDSYYFLATPSLLYTY